jgi:hypothetical protein
MILKKLGVAILAALALSAVVTGTSQAAMWNSSGVGTWASGTSKPAKGRLKAGTTGVLVSKVLGSPFKITFEVFETFETTLIQNFLFAQHTTARWRFVSITIDEPVGCKVSGAVETNPLTGTAQMGNTEATKGSVYEKFAPSSGEVLSTIKLTECAAAGSYQLKGTLYLKGTNPTGTAAVWQEAVTSGEINSSQGGALTLGKEAATLTGAFETALTSEEKYSLQE